jgi:hypothetical protein
MLKMLEGILVKCESTPSVGTAERLQSTIVELLALQELLSSDDVDAAVLADFRHALNRVRNTAWAAQQFVAARLSDTGTANLPSFLAGERVRTAFQLCRSVQEDLKREEIDFQRGQLSELHGVVSQLKEQLKERL